jgi:hypothetical protein
MVSWNAFMVKLYPLKGLTVDQRRKEKEERRATKTLMEGSFETRTPLGTPKYLFISCTNTCYLLTSYDLHMTFK